MAPAADLYPYEHGVTWVMREWMRRASHAIVVDGKVWLVDPVEVPEALEAAEALGSIAGVLQLLDRHPRACRALAERYGVPLHRLPNEAPASGLEVIPVLDKKAWTERALWIASTRTLVVAEVVGTNQYYALSGDAVGVHPGLRFTSAEVGRELPVRHLLVGHGAPVHDDAKDALETAYRHRKRDALLLVRGLRAFVGTGRQK